MPSLGAFAMMTSTRSLPDERTTVSLEEFIDLPTVGQAFTAAALFWELSEIPTKLIGYGQSAIRFDDKHVNKHNDANENDAEQECNQECTAPICAGRPNL